jgi:hypothetical protein
MCKAICRSECAGSDSFSNVHTCGTDCYSFEEAVATTLCAANTNNCEIMDNCLCVKTIVDCGLKNSCTTTERAVELCKETCGASDPCFPSMPTRTKSPAAKSTAAIVSVSAAAIVAVVSMNL